MPLVQSDFKGSTLFHDGHAETILPALLRKIHVTYTREQFDLPDGDFIHLDTIKKNNDKVLILLHGLEGSSQSSYIKGFASYFSSLGWDICVINFRTCSGITNRLLHSYHSGQTNDLRTVIHHLIPQYHQIALTGFSLGGNVLLKYLAEESTAVSKKIISAVAFSVPIDLYESALVMAKWHNRLYMKRFLKSMNAKMIEKSILFPGQIDVKHIHLIKTFHEFDEQYTAPMNGFMNAMDYYQKNSALFMLEHIAIPTLLVNAVNDPFLSLSSFPFDIAKHHPYLYVETPVGGGHVGFSVSTPNGLYWSEVRAHQFISSGIL
jgi:predicted alpha/beta-fold hydrolase